MLSELLRHKIVLCNLHLLLSKVTAHIDHLHTVLESRLDCLDIVCCSNEEHIREIVIHIKIVIVESDILLRIECLEKS